MSASAARAASPLVLVDDTPARPKTVAEQVRAALAEAERLSRASITEYATMIDALADKAAEIAELGKHAPGNFAQDAERMVETLRVSRDSVMSILNKGQ